MIYMPRKTRLKKHVHRAMRKRLVNAKKPMSKEQKADRKKAIEAQKQANKK